MSSLLAAEWVKLTTVRTFLWVALANVAFVAILSIATVVDASGAQSAEESRAAAQIASLALLLGLIAGILVMAGESTHGTITQTLLITPVRKRVMMVKVAVGAAVSLALVLAAELLVLGILVPDGALAVGDARLVLVGTLIAAPIVGAFGVGVGTIFRGQGSAITVSLVWLLIGENVLPLISQTATPYSPARSIAALVSGDRDGNADAYLLGVVPGGLVALLWAVLAVVAGLLVLSRRDA